MPRERIVAGIMSGTSADGIDVALVALDHASRPTLLHDTVHPFNSATRAAILSLAEPDGGDARAVARLNFKLARAYADAVSATLDAAGVPSARLDLIGCHGQTIAHLPNEPEPSTFQAGAGPALAALTGVPVVYDFRAADVALGGQGAPLIPFVDYLLFRERAEHQSIGVLNLGGIANVTLLPAGVTDPAQIVAYDSGPANIVIDGLMRALAGAGYDRDGQVAASGTVHAELLEELLQHPYFDRALPKSTGREEFGAPFVAALIRRGKDLNLADADLVATATMLTVRSIARSLAIVSERHRPDELILGGGGAHNRTLWQMLDAELRNVTLLRHEDVGWPSDAKEAIGFALLADAAVRAVPSALPNVTGTREPLVLGALAPGRTPHVWPDWIGEV
jgi:anhydro-N-acetylmuramic acid kinase